MGEIRNRGVGGHSCVPVAKGLIEAGDEVFVLLGEVICFRGILDEIVELRGGAIDVDEVFPFPLPNGEVGVVFVIPMAKAGAVGWASPADGRAAGGSGLANESLREVFAVQLFGGLGPSQRVEGTVEIDGGKNGAVIRGASLFSRDQTGSPDNERGADAAFIHPGLGTPERFGGAGSGFMTVIGANGDDGVVPELGITTNALEEAGQLFVHGIEDGLIEGAFAAAPFVEGRPPRAVDVIGPEIDEEGFFFGLGRVDEFEGPVDKTGGDFRALHPLETFAESFRIGPNPTGFFAGSLGEREEFWTHAFEVG